MPSGKRGTKRPVDTALGFRLSIPLPPSLPHSSCFLLKNAVYGRYACLAVGQLAVAAVNHEEILAAGGLEGLKSALDCDDDETVFNACYALNKLAMSEGNHEVNHRRGHWRRYARHERCSYRAVPHVQLPCSAPRAP